jgi:RNA polymerase sigma-70 factor (ECF subfamily)
VRFWSVRATPHLGVSVDVAPEYAGRAEAASVHPAEAEIIAALRCGHAEAFDHVYEAHREGLFRFLVRLCGRRELAEDLFQETWLRLARHASALAPDTHVRAWLLTVARNLYRSHVRWSLVDVAALRALARVWYLQPEPVMSGSASKVETDEDSARLQEVVLSLPLAQREALLLVVGEDLSADEAAQVVGIRPEALRQRVSRARAAIAIALERPRSARAPGTKGKRP